MAFHDFRRVHRALVRRPPSLNCPSYRLPSAKTRRPGRAARRTRRRCLPVISTSSNNFRAKIPVIGIPSTIVHPPFAPAYPFCIVLKRRRQCTRRLARGSDRVELAVVVAKRPSKGNSGPDALSTPQTRVHPSHIHGRHVHNIRLVVRQIRFRAFRHHAATTVARSPCSCPPRIDRMGQEPVDAVPVLLATNPLSSCQASSV